MTDVYERYRLSLPQTRTTLDRVDAWWRCANHVAAGLPGGRRPEVAATTLMYAHLNRMIVRRQHRIRFVLGLRDGAPALEAIARMEGAAPHRPVEGGGSYAMSYSVGMALDEPGLTVACLVDDAQVFSARHDPYTDGAVLPILYNPAMHRQEIRAEFAPRGWEPIEVEPQHRSLAVGLYVAFDEMAAMTPDARWPMLVLRMPKDWPPADDAPADWFDAGGRPIADIAVAAPTGSLRMSADG